MSSYNYGINPKALARLPICLLYIPIQRSVIIAACSQDYPIQP